MDRLALLRDAIDAALKGLSTVPQDATIVALIVDAQRLHQQVEQLQGGTPTPEHLAELERLVLSLHKAVAEVRRS